MRLAWLPILALAAAAARADTANVGKATGVLNFNVPAARAASGGEPDVFPGALDLDADGEVSRAEAAGHANVTLGFDRADRNRDGKVSRAEWQRYEKEQERRAKAREAASAGATRAKRPPRSAP